MTPSEHAYQRKLGRALEDAYGRYNEQGTKYAAEHYARLWDHLLDALKEGTVDVT